MVDLRDIQTAKDSTGMGRNWKTLKDEKDMVLYSRVISESDREIGKTEKYVAVIEGHDNAYYMFVIETVQGETHEQLRLKLEESEDGFVPKTDSTIGTVSENKVIGLLEEMLWDEFRHGRKKYEYYEDPNEKYEKPLMRVKNEISKNRD